MSVSYLKTLKLYDSILANYLMGRVLKLMLMIFVIVTLVIFGNQLVLVIKESLAKGILFSDLFPLVGLKMIRDVSLILSLSLFLSVILAVSQAYKNSEAVIMNAIGLGDKHFMMFIQPIVLAVCVFILFLSTVAVPWSKQARSDIMDKNAHHSEFTQIKQGEFQEFRDGDLVFYADKVEDADAQNQQTMEQIFIYLTVDEELTIILAKSALKYTDKDTGDIHLKLQDGKRYHGFQAQANKQILNFRAYDLKLFDNQAQKPADKIIKTDAKSTAQLWGSDDVKDIAELQWRFSQPLSVLILAVLGVLLGKTAPRNGKNLGALIGVVIFITYNNLLMMAQAELEKGDYSPTIGLWWVHLLMIIGTYIFYAKRHRKLDFLLNSFTSRTT